MRKILLLGVLFPFAALAQQPATFSGEGGTVSYKLVHKFHEMTGVSRSVEAKARVLPEGTIQVAARAKVDSFDSGNANRDAHMLEAVEGTKFPAVEVKMVAQGVALPAKFPAEVKAHFKGAVVFHGVQQPQQMDAALKFSDPGHAEVVGGFALSIEAFGIERPSLVFVKVDDDLKISVDLKMKKDSP